MYSDTNRLVSRSRCSSYSWEFSSNCNQKVSSRDSSHSSQLTYHEFYVLHSLGVRLKFQLGLVKCRAVGFALGLHSFNFLSSCFVVRQCQISVLDHVLQDAWGSVNQRTARTRYEGEVNVLQLARKTTLGTQKAVSPINLHVDHTASTR